jgi:hypothetical protein
MPAWIHSLAEHILAKNPSMPKGEAFAIATEQSHATGHTPKGYGTAAGKREAKRTYDTPKGDEQKANPGGLRSPKMKHKTAEAVMWGGFFDEMEKIALSGGAITGGLRAAVKEVPAATRAVGRVAGAAEHAAIPAATSHISGMRPAARVPVAPTPLRVPSEPLPTAARGVAPAPFQGVPNVPQPAPTYRGSMVGAGAPAHPGLMPGEVAPWVANPAAGPAAQRMAASNAAMQAKGHPGLAFI